MNFSELLKQTIEILLFYYCFFVFIMTYDYPSGSVPLCSHKFYIFRFTTRAAKYQGEVERADIRYINEPNVD